MSAVAALAEWPERFLQVFGTDTYNEEGIFVINAYIRGVPVVYTVDDYLPFYNDKLVFASAAKDGGIWPAIIEKAYAKANGNYENIEAGWTSEVLDFLVGSPYQFFDILDKSTINQSASKAYAIIKAAEEADYIMTSYTDCDTDDDTNSYGLPTCHTYTLMGVYELKDSKGKVTNKLIRFKNPWGYDTYSGKWKDSDKKWTDAIKK